MMRSLFFFMVLGSSVFLSQRAVLARGSCFKVLRAVALRRPLSDFPGQPRAEYTQARDRERSDKSRWTLPENHEAISEKLRDLLALLADRSEISGALSEPGPVDIFVTQHSGDEVPEANMVAGVFSMNRKMLESLRSDDELAAVVGYQFLHQSLLHDVDLLKDQDRWWMKWLSARSGSGFFRELLEMRIDWLKANHRRAVARALPVLLRNAGFDPWAVVDYFDRLLEQTEGGSAFIDGYTRLRVMAHVGFIKHYLQANGFERNFARGHERLGQILDLLPKAPETISTATSSASSGSSLSQVWGLFGSATQTATP